jgi:predicted ribosome quality control (RQC) complex YloA/Tae2 family protein
MSFDGIVTRAVTHELQDELTSCRIAKIYQPSETEIVITVRAKGKNQNLLLSVHPSYARLHITTDSFTNPKTPPMFCMVLRKYLIGGFIEKFEQIEMERIIKIHISNRNELGDITNKTLVMEIMGKHSNLILLDEQKQVILDSIKHIPPHMNRVRSILPGQPYIMPPGQGKTNPLTIKKEQFIQKLDFNSGNIEKQIVHQLMGFSPLIAKELVYRAYLGSPEKYMEAFAAIQQNILEHNYQPAIYRGDKEYFYVLPLTSLKVSEMETFPSISELLTNFYSGKAERDRVKQQAKDIHRVLINEKAKIERKIKKHEHTLKDAEKADEYKKLGELLTAHMHLVKQGDKQVTVVDYYDPEAKELVIELDPNKSPSENAQNLFQKYHKLKNAKEYILIETEKSKEELLYLEQIIMQIESARLEDLEEIREELQENGYLKKKAGLKKRKQNTTPQLDKYISSDGTIILVGRNNKQNDYLTNKLARKNHIWLHTKDIPGSHVVIQADNPSEETLKEGAVLAAYFSKAHMSSSVPVDYTKIKHVKKISGGKLGFVTYEQQKTIFVTPDERIVKQLKKNS